MFRALVLVLALVFSAMATMPIAGQELDDPSARHPLVGSWFVPLTIDGLDWPIGSLLSITADGVAMASVGTPAQFTQVPMMATRDQFVTGHGAWEPTGPESARVALAFHVAGPNGGLFGVNMIRGDTIVDQNGGNFSGSFTLESVSLDGSRMETGRGTWQAARISANPIP